MQLLKMVTPIGVRTLSSRALKADRTGLGQPSSKGQSYKTFTAVFMDFRNKLVCLSVASFSSLV
jgi:hypothetical protein